MKLYIHDGVQKQTHIAWVDTETLQFVWNEACKDYLSMTDAERSEYKRRVISDLINGEYNRTKHK